MHLPRCSLGLLAASAATWMVAAAMPEVVPEKFVRPAFDSPLRLIKTSPSDEGTWMTQDQILEMAEKKVGFVDITDVSAEELAILSLPDGEVSTKLMARQTSYPSALSHQTEANPLVARATSSNPMGWLLTLTNFQNRYYTSTYGLQAANWLFSQLTTLAAPNSAITVARVAHSGFNQPSIVVTIPGSASSELVIVGAHFDTTGGASGRAPGADDNGSGVVVLMEALRVLASSTFRPQNTIEFHFYAAEEVGLVGSQRIFSSYRTAGKTVLAFVNQDMTGYSPSGKISVYTDYVSTPLTAYVRLSATTYGGAGAPTSDRCGYGCSDHASANSNGFPAAYVCDEVMATSSPYIHSSADAYSTIGSAAILRHSKFTIGFLVEASYL